MSFKHFIDTSSERVLPRFNCLVISRLIEAIIHRCFVPFSTSNVSLNVNNGCVKYC